MKSTLLLSMAFLVSQTGSFAQGFISDYDVANWTTTKTTTGSLSGAENTGSVDISNAPGEITLIGSDGPEANAVIDVNVDFTITATTTGSWSFDWSYTTLDDSAQFDPVFVLINGAATLLTDDTRGDQPQNGTFSSSTVINIGDVIGFRISSAENAFGNASVIITNFSAPADLLPVTLEYFNAAQNAEQVRLEWSTASEINSDRFEVERSANGKDFISILSIKAAGNTSLQQYYNAIDNNPEYGNNLYRLRIVDLDGKYEYSFIKVVRWTNIDRIKLYPNPARASVTLRLTPERNGNTSILLIDANGKIIQSQQITGIAGSNSVTDWDVQMLQPGFYYFKISNISSPVRFAKQ